MGGGTKGKSCTELIILMFREFSFPEWELPSIFNLFLEASQGRRNESQVQNHLHPNTNTLLSMPSFWKVPRSLCWREWEEVDDFGKIKKTTKARKLRSYSCSVVLEFVEDFDSAQGQGVLVMQQKMHFGRYTHLPSSWWHTPCLERSQDKNSSFGGWYSWWFVDYNRPHQLFQRSSHPHQLDKNSEDYSRPGGGHYYNFDYCYGFDCWCSSHAQQPANGCSWPHQYCNLHDSLGLCPNNYSVRNKQNKSCIDAFFVQKAPYGLAPSS